MEVLVLFIFIYIMLEHYRFKVLEQSFFETLSRDHSQGSSHLVDENLETQFIQLKPRLHNYALIN